MKKIKPGCAWTPEIQTFERFFCRAFGNFPCAGTLKILSSSLLHSEDMRIFRAASIGTRKTRWKKPTWKIFQVLRSICIMLIHTENILQLSSCLTGCIVDVGGVRHYLCRVYVAGFRHHFGSVCFSHLTPFLPLSVSSSPSPSLPFLPSSSLSVEPPVTDALSLIQKSGSTER